MKKTIITLTTFFALSILSFSQKGRGGEVSKDITSLDLKKDFNVSGKSVLKKSKVAGIVKGSLHFKGITSDLKYIGKGQQRTTAKSWAILENVSAQTLQEISDEFAQSFAKKIEGLGIELQNWQKITTAKNFAKINDKQIKKEKSNQSTGLVEIKTANNGPHLKPVIGNPGTWGALAKTGKDFGGNAITYDINIDFARFDIDAKRWRTHQKTYNGTRTTTYTSAEANVVPQICIESSNGAQGLGRINTNLTFVGKYGEATIIDLNKNIYTPTNFAKEIKSTNGVMPTRMKKMFTFNTMTTGTFTVVADEQAYKKAVLEALDAYSDYLISVIKQEIRK